MSRHLKAKFTPAFSRDLKRLAKRHDRDMDDLAEVIDLIMANTKESLRILKQHHNMHRLSGKWKGSSECHVANAGDWLLVWTVDKQFAYLQRTGSHDELFR